MTPVRDLDGRQAQEIEEQLFTTHRQQLQRHVPIPLPRQDFWVMVRALLSSLDLEIQDMVRKGSIDMRLQNLQKRQTNIRRIASELAQTNGGHDATRRIPIAAKRGQSKHGAGASATGLAATRPC